MGVVGGSGGGWQCQWVEKKSVSLLDDLEQRRKEGKIKRKNKNNSNEMVKRILNVECIVNNLYYIL